jgi:hypothetical protein
VSEAALLRQMEDEYRRLRQLVADLSLDKEILKAMIRKNGCGLTIRLLSYISDNCKMTMNYISRLSLFIRAPGHLGLQRGSEETSVSF